jgi:hypothetical protein
MSEHPFEDKLEERDDVVDGDGDQPTDGGPWAKTSSGDGDSTTDDGGDD